MRSCAIIIAVGDDSGLFSAGLRKKNKVMKTKSEKQTKGRQNYEKQINGMYGFRYKISEG